MERWYTIHKRAHFPVDSLPLHCNLLFSIVIADENFAEEIMGIFARKLSFYLPTMHPKKPDEISCFLYPPTKDF